MSDHIILVEKPSDWKNDFPEAKVVTAKDYLHDPQFLKLKNAKVINLCRDYRYLNIGYYCSLLAEARRHKVLPTVRTITDLGQRGIYRLVAEDLEGIIAKSLKNKSVEGEKLELPIFFGQCQHADLQDLARQLFDMFRCPLLKLELRYKGSWNIAAIRPLTLNTLTPENETFFIESLSSYLNKPWRTPRARWMSKYDLAILHNPQEQMPPSNRRALDKFIKIGKTLGLQVDLIERKDFSKVAEYDALFIRETTPIDHHTYRFAIKAESEGMVVMDDPNSIVKCTNKVYLAELLALHKVPTPKTVIVQKEHMADIESRIGYPAVLKIPDGSFSRGVFKANNADELKEISTRLFKESDLILAQEFCYTEFDWRIGILNRQPIYACQYFMSKHHWQIVKHNTGGRFEQGGSRSLPIEDVPATVLDAALKAANLIGDGLYGVDIKQGPKGIYVIEVNDNPNLDVGVEDAFLGDKLYRLILEEFIRRIELRR